MEKFFNTAGPIQSDIHYSVDPLSRVNLAEIELNIHQRKYFILHAPRQTGKTTTLLALRDYLNRKGNFVCVYANVEGGQAARNNVRSVIDTVCSTIASRADTVLRSDTSAKMLKSIEDIDCNAKLAEFLKRLSINIQKPLVLLIDEIDSLVGDSLVSVLRQIRSGYDQRPDAFPQSIILCGVRDVRDYRIVLSNQDIVTGGSAFNIKAFSLRLGNFNKDEICALYNMHTSATGQQFDNACFDLIWQATEGQPWLVNAIGYEVTWQMTENRDRTIRIIPEMIYRAQERIIYRRDTHIDILIDRLREPRVKNVIEPILSGNIENKLDTIQDDDLQYAEDLGLIVRDKPIRIANAIYREIIPRELTWAKQQTMTEQPAWFINNDSTININKLLKEFQRFYRENAEAWDKHFDYREAGPQLLLQAFLQRIINGGGYIDREYGLGMKRTDLLIRKPLTDTYGGPVQKIVIEIKIQYGKIETLTQEALEQTDNYIERMASDLKEGHIIIFDRDSKHTWDEKIYCRQQKYNNRTYTIWGV